MILFRFAWVITLVIMVGQALSSCLATPKAFPETSWPRLRAPLPQWLQHPDAVVDVVWHRGSAGPAVVRNGACHVQMHDTGEQDLDVAEAQLQACLASGQLRTAATPPAGAIRVHWHQVRGTEAVVAKYRELFATGTWPLAGFYFHPRIDGPCHVITSLQHRALGHELKHCFDGRFHAARNRWLPNAARRD